MTRQLTYSFAVILLAAACVYADPPVTAQIPFSFHVGDSTLPSGSYRASTSGAGGGVLCLRSANGKSAVLVLSHGVQASAGRARAVLIFHKYGEEYFLFQVWSGGDIGRELRKSPHETELAATAKGSVQTIFAQR